MSHFLFLFIIIIHLCCLSFAQSKIERPKLVVGIVVDQMRYEYLYRFYNHYGEDGFKRLLNDGFELKNAHFKRVFVLCCSDPSMKYVVVSIA